MTYRELQEALSKLNTEELDYNIMAFDNWNDQYFPVASLEKSSEDNGFLAIGHPVLILKQIVCIKKQT